MTRRKPASRAPRTGDRGRRRRRDLLAVVEAVYRTDEPDDDWLQALADSSLAPLDRGLGLVAVEFHSADGGSVLSSEPATAGMSQRLREVMLAGWTTGPAEHRPRALPGGGMCVTASEALGEAFTASPYLRDALAPEGVGDILWVGTPDPAGNCCAIGVGLPEPTRLSPGARRQLRFVAAHLATALRLRRRLSDLDDGGEAVIRSDGLVDRARGDAMAPAARAALRAAAVAVDMARGELRDRDGERALSLWRSLVAARWSLVDEFDRRGRRYFIAHVNEPRSNGSRELTRREQLVVQYAALGHANKFIAYELGLGESTVATYLKRAMTKLGVATRFELIERFGSSQGR